MFGKFSHLYCSTLPSSLTLSVSQESVLTELSFFSLSACFLRAGKKIFVKRNQSCHPGSPTFHYKFSVSLSRSVLGQDEVLWKVKVFNLNFKNFWEDLKGLQRVGRAEITCSADPLHVTSQLFLQLLLFLQRHEASS